MSIPGADKQLSTRDVTRGPDSIAEATQNVTEGPRRIRFSEKGFGHKF